MNKSELVERMAEDAGIPKEAAGNALDALIDAITLALQNGESVSILGFGSFSVREYAAREGRNPQTKKKIKIPATKRPVFKAGKTLKEAVK